MKNYKIWHLLLSIISLTPAIDSSAAITPKTASVTIVVNDAAYRQGLTVSFKIYQDGINTDRAGYTNYYTFKLNERVTKCKLPLSTELNYGRIELYNPSPSFQDWDMPLDFGNDLFIFENGDDVTINLGTHKNQATFSGKSAGKFECLFELSTADYEKASAIWNIYYAKNEPYQGFLEIKTYCDSLTNAKIATLNAFPMNPQVKELVKLDLWAQGNQRAISSPYVIFSLRSSKKEWLPAAKKFILAYCDNGFELPEATEKLLATSYKLGDFLADLAKYYAVVINSTDTSSYYRNTKYKDIWSIIDKHYKPGLLKDKVTLMSFVGVLRDRENDFVDYTAQSFGQALPSNIKTALGKIDSVNKKGNGAFQFALSDQKGKIVRLVDLKGKVVILDFWFTGCMACLQLTKVMKPLIAEYKANPNIVFVSISIDRSRSGWLQSLKEGKYTSEDEINLLAENGGQSKIVQNYNIDGFPTLIVISKEGKIISTAPPDPQTDLSGFKALLNSTL